MANGTINDVFLTFFRTGLLTFGGGYTVLPLLQREAAEKKNWITQSEVMDYYAVAQCLPGMIGVNAAILIGYKVRGKAGALAAACGFAMPSLLIILLIASLIQNISTIPLVQSAFAGIRVAVCALVVNAIYTMAKKAVIDVATAVIAIAAFAAAVWLELSPVPLVALSAALGLGLSLIQGKWGKGVAGVAGAAGDADAAGEADTTEVAGDANAAEDAGDAGDAGVAGVAGDAGDAGDAGVAGDANAAEDAGVADDKAGEGR